MRLNDANGAIGIFKRHYDDLPQPAGDLACGTAVEASGDIIAAVPRYERVYYEFPTAAEAPNAAAAIARLKAALGSRYPAPPPTMVLSRASKLIDTGRAAEAKRELEAVLPQFTGTELDSARVRIGAADYGAREFRAALAWLRNLDIQTPDLDAERLYYVLQAARRIDSTADVDAALAALSVKHTLPVAVAGIDRGRKLLQPLEPGGRVYAYISDLLRVVPERDGGGVVPLEGRIHEVCPARFFRHRDAARTCPALPEIRQSPGRALLPGPRCQTAGRTGEARAFLDEIEKYYPNEYYAVLARERLTQPAIRSAAPDRETAAFLRSISFPPRARRANFSPDAEAKRRIERARLLSAAAADWSAETELRFGATKSSEPQVYALELARSASRRSAPDVGVRPHESPRAGISLLSARRRPQRVLGTGLPPAMARRGFPLLGGERPRPLHGRGPDPPGIGVQSESGVQSKCLRTHPDTPGDRPRSLAPATEDAPVSRRVAVRPRDEYPTRYLFPQAAARQF